MKRDTIKTLIGLFIIGLIVVATFMYGNAQRQAQQKRDQATNKPQPSPSRTVASSVTPTPSGAPAPVQSPGVVGGGAKTTPTTGGTGKDLPETGSPWGGVIGAAALVGTGLAWRRSQRALVDAARRWR